MNSSSIAVEPVGTGFRPSPQSGYGSRSHFIEPVMQGFFLGMEGDYQRGMALARRVTAFVAGMIR